MIKNLLFDLGGVIMDIRRQNCEEAFRQLGMANPEQFLGDYCQSGPFEGIENGSVSPDGFRRSIREIIGNPDLTDHQIDSAFQRFLIGIPRHRLEELRCLHGEYHIYMLSNTNPIMWNDVIARNFRQEGHDVDYYFDGIVRSFEARSMKPDLGIFRTAIDRFHIRPEETLFLDDSRRNLEAAASLGFQTLLVEPGAEFMDRLREFPGFKTACK